jgi:hypothetical protein
MPIIIGVLIIGKSLMTDYELGVVKAIPMGVHLTLDIATGVILAVSPWVFGFADEIWWPHVVFGVLEIGAALMTHTTPEDDDAAAGIRVELYRSSLGTASTAKGALNWGPLLPAQPP